MAERSKAAVLKTVVAATSPGVRIPLSLRAGYCLSDNPFFVALKFEFEMCNGFGVSRSLLENDKVLKSNSCWKIKKVFTGVKTFLL